MHGTTIAVVGVEPESAAGREGGGSHGREDGWSLLEAVLGGVEGERVEAVARSADAGPGRCRDGLAAADIVCDEVRHCVVRVVLKLVLYPLVNCVRLDHHLSHI